MTVNRDPSPRKRSLRSATTTEMDDQEGLENKPPPLPKSNNNPAGSAEGGVMVLQPLDDATRLEKNVGAKEAESSVEEGGICTARTVQRIPSATEFLEMRKAQRSPTRPEQTSRPPRPVAADLMPDSPPVSATPARPPSVGCSTASLTHDGPPTSQAKINLAPSSPAGVHPIIFPPPQARYGAPPPEDIHQQTQSIALNLDGGSQIRGRTACEESAASLMTGEQGTFPTPRKVAMDSMDERLQGAKEKPKATVKSARSKKQGNRKAGSGESSSGLRDVEEGAAGPLIHHEDEAGDDGGGTKQGHSPEAQDAAPQEDGNNGSRDSRGESNTEGPYPAQGDANQPREKEKNPKRRRESSSSEKDVEMIVFPKRTRRNSNLALTAILESVHLSNTGLRLFEDERNETLIRKAQSHLRTERFLTDIGLANITRLFRDVKLASEYLQLWEGPFSVVSMKEWFLVELKDWKKRGGSISGQGGRGDNFEDNFFPTPRLVLVEAPPLNEASGPNAIPTEHKRMVNNPHRESLSFTPRGKEDLPAEESCFYCSRSGHEAKACPGKAPSGSKESKKLFPGRKSRRG